MRQACTRSVRASWFNFARHLSSLQGLPCQETRGRKPLTISQSSRELNKGCDGIDLAILVCSSADLCKIFTCAQWQAVIRKQFMAFSLRLLLVLCSNLRSAQYRCKLSPHVLWPVQALQAPQCSCNDGKLLKHCNVQTLLCSCTAIVCTKNQF